MGDGQQKEVTITYETIYELLRLERSREELQKLPSTFLYDVLNYLKEKQQILNESMQKSDLFSAAEKEKTTVQVDNIRKLIRELYQKREKKIIDIALNKSRTGSNIIDTSNLLNVEKHFFEKLVALLDLFRQGILVNILALQQPGIGGEIKEEADEKQEETIPKQEEKEQIMESSEIKNTKQVKFLENVSQFVDKELDVHGPFESDQIAELPEEIVEILVESGKAEMVE